MKTIAVALVLAFAGCAVDADETSDTDDAATLPGSYDLWQADDGQWHFHLAAGNGATLLASEAYTTRTGAINGILAVRDFGGSPANYAVVPAAHGYLLHLASGNSVTIAFTEPYSTKSNATRAITSCVNAVTTYNAKVRNRTTGPRVTVSRGDFGKFTYAMYTTTSLPVLTSAEYIDEASAWNAALSAQEAPVARYAVQPTNDGYAVVVKAANGQVVGTSLSYATVAEAQADRDGIVAAFPSLDVL